MDGLALFKFLLIALALPAQYLITQYWSKDINQQREALRSVIDSVYQFKDDYLQLESWKKWYFSFVVDKPREYKKKMVQQAKNLNAEQARKYINEIQKYHYDDDIAVEVLNYRKKLENFGESALTRAPRPSGVTYRVGQVVKHKKFNFYGVIIGWDTKAQAPEDWLSVNYEAKEREYYRNQPHYLMLVDDKYQKEHSSKTYVAQEHIEIILNQQVRHRLLSTYFSFFDGGQYTTKKFLKTIYPHD